MTDSAGMPDCKPFPVAAITPDISSGTFCHSFGGISVISITILFVRL